MNDETIECTVGVVEAMRAEGRRVFEQYLSYEGAGVVDALLNELSRGWLVHLEMQEIRY